MENQLLGLYINKKYLTLFSSFLILFFSGFLAVDLMLNKGIFTAHDIESNLVNFASFYSSFSEGILIPRWAGNVANLYGGPNFIFYYPMSYYLTLIFPFIGFSLIDSVKIYIFITFILSSLFMYLWLRKHVNNIAAVVGGLLYVYAPYRITDIYARGSVAENTAFLFIPLVAYGIFSVVLKPTIKKMILLSLIISCLILTHPFMLVIFFPFYFIYVLYLKPNINKIVILLGSTVLSLLITSYYTIPLLYENKYTHYSESSFSGSEYASQFLNFKKLIMPIWTFIDIKGQLEYQSYQIGLVQLVIFSASIASLFVLKLKSKGHTIKTLLIVGIVNFLLSTFFMLPISDFIYRVFPLLHKIQFPWRFLSLNIFSIAIIGSSLVTVIGRKAQIMVLISIIFSVLVLYVPYAKGHKYIEFSDSHYLYENIENLDAFASLPLWAAQPDKYSRPITRFEMIEGNARVTEITRTSTKHIYQVESSTYSRLVDNTFYFPGWKVFINKKNTEIEFQDPAYRGLITFKIPPGKHIIEVFFTKTKIRQFAEFISIMSVLLTFIMYIYATKIQKNINNNPSI